VLPADGRPPGIPAGDETSEATQQLVDREVRRLVEEAHQEALRLLSENRDRLDGLASALLEHETLDEDEAYAAARIERRPAERREPVAGYTA
jgi:cell division protease FtsH